MGLFSSKKKQKQTFNQTQTQTSTPTNPQWVTDGAQSLAGQIGALSGADPRSFVAGADPLQQQAAAGAGALGQFAGYRGMAGGRPGAGGGAFNMIAGGPGRKAATRGGGASDPYGDAMNIAAGVSRAGPNEAGIYTGGAASVLDNLDAYMSPYTKDVVDASLADFDYGAGVQRGAAQADVARSKAFGGSRAAIGQSMLEGELARGRANTSATLRDTAFTRGAALSADDANRRQQMTLSNMSALNTGGQFNAGQRDNALNRSLSAAGLLGDAASAQGANTRANIGLQADVGASLQDIAQNQAQSPLSLLGTQAALFSGLPLGMFRGETSTGTASGQSNSVTSGGGSILGSLGGLLSAGGSLAEGLGALGIGFGKRKGG